jgi:hypothetical protein
MNWTSTLQGESRKAINLEEKTFTGKGETFELDNQDTKENQTASASAFSKYSYDR